MADVNVTGQNFGNALTEIMDCNEIRIGDAPSYQTCKTIYAYHPLGAKLVEAPIKLAQSQEREITVAKGPTDLVRDAFVKEWKDVGVDEIIFDVVRQARIYGIASVAIVVKGEDSAQPIKLDELYKKEIAFNVFDPLITAGSLIYSQNPNAIDYQKTTGTLSVQGQIYHHTRTAVQLNEKPLFIEWTTSAFGFVGRSVYQRTLYALQSYLQTMRTDDMVARKAGIIVAMIKQAGSIVNALMEGAAWFKRNIVKEAQTGNVINIDVGEEISAIDLTNVNAAMEQTRKDILNNIAAGAGMPSILVNEETFAEGFGEGSEDAKHVALFIEQFRDEMRRLYEFFDEIIQYRAWNEEFFEALKNEFPDEYGNETYNVVFAKWKKAFTTRWPSLIVEPDSEKAKKDDISLKGVTSIAEILLPLADPANKATIITWIADTINTLDTIFTVPLVIDAEAFAEYAEEQKQQMDEQMAQGMGGPGDEEDGDQPGQKMPKPPAPQGVSRGDAAILQLLRNGTRGR